MPFIAIALIIAAAVGGGTSFAAQNALPGDALWSFKVNVNENVEAALAPAGKAQADFDIGVIEARLKETAKLVAGSTLSANAKTDIESNLDVHAKDVEAQIARLQAQGDFAAAADIAARYQAVLAANESALADAEASAPADTESKASVKANLNGIIGSLSAALSHASTVSAEASAKAAADANGKVDTHGADANATEAGRSGSVRVQTGTSVRGATASSTGQVNVQL